MRDIKELFDQKGLSYLMHPKKFENIKPLLADYFLDFVADVITTDNSMLGIVPDIDIDGQLSAKIVFDMFHGMLGYRPYVYQHMSGSHGISRALVMQFIQEKFTHILIVDSSSNEMENIEMLTRNGIKVCIIDHHIMNYHLSDYPEGCVILSSKLKEYEGKLPYSDASCGLLCALYCNYVMHAFNRVMPNDSWVYGVITLYSDCMNTLNEFNVMVIDHVRSIAVMPSSMQGISGRKSAEISREVITYSLNPKMNACLRLERFDLLFELLFKATDYKRNKEIFEEIKQINKSLKDDLRIIRGGLRIEDMCDLCFFDMTDMSNTNYTNLKGLLANGVGDSEGKLAIGTYVQNGLIMGSVRDPQGRDILSIFKRYCQADGHPSAFGFQIEEFKISGLLDYVSECLVDMKSDSMKPIVLNSREYGMDSQTLAICAALNEYTTVNKVMFSLHLTPEKYVIRSSKYGYTVSSAEIRIDSNVPITYGSVVLAMPVLDPKPKLKIKAMGGK